MLQKLIPSIGYANAELFNVILNFFIRKTGNFRIAILRTSFELRAV